MARIHGRIGGLTVMLASVMVVDDNSRLVHFEFCDDSEQAESTTSPAGSTHTITTDTTAIDGPPISRVINLRDHQHN